MENKILINFAHPRYEKSAANKAMLSAIEGLEGLTFNDLYQEYPDFLINVEREQQLLLEHDIILFQHPFYWYSGPSLLKEWQDLVLDNGFAYGDGGYQLEGKAWINAITVGGDEQSYSADGYNKVPLSQLLTPYQQSADFCGMNYLEPFIIYNTLKSSHEQLVSAAEDYRTLLFTLQNNKDLFAKGAD